MPHIAKSSTFTLPARRHRSRRLFRTFLALLLGIPLTHRLVYWHFAHDLQRQIDAIHASGEPVEPADFAQEPPADDNASNDVTAAAAILDDGSIDSASIEALPTTRPMPSEAWPYLDHAVDWFEPALKRMDRAMTKSHCQWSHAFRSPLQTNLLMPELNQCRHVSELANAAAVVEHRRQRDDLVVLRLQQMLFLANACEHSPSPGHLCACGIVGMLAGRVEELASSLRIGDGIVGAAPPSEVCKLIAALTDESNSVEALKYQLSSERSLDLDDCRSLFDGDPIRDIDEYVYGPALDHDASAYMDVMTQILNATSTSANWPTANMQLSTIPEPHFWLLYFGNQSRAFQIHFQSLTDRRLAATALAVRLYRANHNENFPPPYRNWFPTICPPCRSIRWQPMEIAWATSPAPRTQSSTA